MNRRVGSLVVALAAIGCGDDSDSNHGLGAPSQFPVPGCEAIDHAPCDVWSPFCQERLHALAACLRGSEAGSLPSVTSMTDAQYVSYLNERFAANPPEDSSDYERALVLLGLIEPGALSFETYTVEVVQHVDGVYRDEFDDIVLLDHGGEPDPQTSSNVLVHEFVHALQDRDLDLRAFMQAHETTSDSSLAARSMIEGEARLHQSRHWASLLGLDPAEVDWIRHFQGSLELSESWLLTQASAFTATRYVFPYAWGARYMSFAWLANGTLGVRERLSAPPATSHALMATVNGLSSPELTPVTIEAPVPPSEWTLRLDDQLGAWSVFLALTTAATDVTRARELALKWRGDRFSVYIATAGAESEAAVVWQLVFADSESATAVEQEAAALVSPFNVARSDAEVVLAVSESGLPLVWALRR
jgi:hypothetical protein